LHASSQWEHRHRARRGGRKRASRDGNAVVSRFDCGHLIPSIGRVDGATFALAGPDAVSLRTPIDLKEHKGNASATFTVSAGERVPFQLSWFPSHEAPPPAVDPAGMISSTEDWWAEWSGRCQYEGPFREEALRSLITLKALTYEPTGAIVAAPTTSLPEEIGGERNWDYRFCWLRDGAFTLIPFVRTGYRDEAVAWRNWLLRAVAGDPEPASLGVRHRR
jgi:GH15 family glucan-1,4-alpha-glucosidase